jgi:hypothetical protein
MSKSPSRRGNDLHHYRRQDLTPVNGVLRKMADLVLHDRVEPEKERRVGLGVKNGAKRRFSEDEIRAMRRRYQNGERICDMAREFNLAHRNMSMILQGESYAWVKE